MSDAQKQQTPAVSDRRKFPRVDVSCDLKYRAVDLQTGASDISQNAPGVMSNYSAVT